MLAKILCLALAIVAGWGAHAAAPPPLEPISIRGFHDSISHWRKIQDDGRFIKALPDQPSYAPEQVREIAANLLLFQRADGGWPKDYDMTAKLTEEQRAAVVATHGEKDSSFDNGNLHAQVAYLARALAQEPNASWQAACERGLDFILGCQYENGGFPQRWPRPKDFHAHITFNDYVTIGCLQVLLDASGADPAFRWLDEGRRARARDAVSRGVACILLCQIRVEGRLTGWCQQHDEKTFEPRAGRTFELASICPQDTAEIVKFLMRLEPPSPEVRTAIDSAVGWLAKARLSGVRVESFAAPKVQFQRYAADFDKRLIQDPDAPALWARHYEIGTNRPVFAGRDGVRHYDFNEIERERRTGTPWFGDWPAELLEVGYAKWQQRVGMRAE